MLLEHEFRIIGRVPSDPEDLYVSRYCMQYSLNNGWDGEIIVCLP